MSDHNQERKMHSDLFSLFVLADLSTDSTATEEDLDKRQKCSRIFKSSS
jgi:hypothetical protein